MLLMVGEQGLIGSSLGKGQSTLARPPASGTRFDRRSRHRADYRVVFKVRPSGQDHRTLTTGRADDSSTGRRSSSWPGRSSNVVSRIDLTRWHDPREVSC